MPSTLSVCCVASGYLRLVMPDDAEVLTVEVKANMLAPASGDRLVAEREVVRAGRTLTVCRGGVYAERDPIAYTWRRCLRRRCAARGLTGRARQGSQSTRASRYIPARSRTRTASPLP